MAAAAAEWEEERSVMEEEDGDIEDVPPPPLLGRNGDSEDEAEAGSLNSQRWPRSFRYVRARCILYDLVPSSKGTGALVPKRLVNDLVFTCDMSFIFQPH